MLRYLPALLFTAPLLAAAPPTLPLWEKGAPGFEDKKDVKETRAKENKATGEYCVTGVHNPYVTLHLPPKEKATGAAVVVVPGGGHRELWVMHEGENIAAWLCEQGVAAVVLRHRLAREKDSPYKIDVHALQDGQRALRLVRSKAKEWNLDPARVGMMGFSAGGEVVGLVCRKADKGDPKATDPIDRESAVPAFQALVYPGPQGIRGETISKDNCPPLWALVGDDDPAAAWLVTHYQDAKKAGVSAELHAYAKTGHGFGFRPAKATGKPVEGWPTRFVEFLGVQGVLRK